MSENVHDKTKYELYDNEKEETNCQLKVVYVILSTQYLNKSIIGGLDLI